MRARLFALALFAFPALSLAAATPDASLLKGMQWRDRMRQLS